MFLYIFTMEEIWKDIEGYEGLYQVSNNGFIRSLDKFDSIGRRIKGKHIKTQESRFGYYRVSLCREGKVTTHSVHRLVAQTFIPNTDNKPEIDHINTNRTDNRVENLRWVTRKENNENPLTKIHKKRGNEHPKPFKGKVGILHPTSKSVLQYTKDGIFVKRWESISLANKHYNTTHISDCCLGKRKNCVGFVWVFEKQKAA